MCQNPFRKKKCSDQSIAVILQIKGESYEICYNCWFGKRKDGKDGLGESNWQWNESGSEEYKNGN